MEAVLSHAAPPKPVESRVPGNIRRHWRFPGNRMLQSRSRMNPEKKQTLRQQASFWVKDLGLYTVIAVFLALAPLVREHWLIILGLSWLLAAVIVGRMIRIVTERIGVRPFLAAT